MHKLLLAAILALPSSLQQALLCTAVDTAQPRSDLFAVFARATLSGEDFSDAILLVSALRAALLTDAKMVLDTSL